MEQAAILLKNTFDAATIFSQSPKVTAIVFLQRTCFLAFNAAIVMLACTIFDVHTLTASIAESLIKKYGEKAKEKNQELIPNDLTAHKIRHTTAMGLWETGVDLIYIRDLLGHSSVVTTEVYARTDAKPKRKAIEAASKEILPAEAAKWDSDSNLKEWLKSFNKR